MANLSMLNGHTICDKEARAGLASKVGTSELVTAVNTALTNAKNSGEFDGKKGDTGVGITNITITEV